MARVKLTAGRVRDFGLRPGQQQSFLWDSESPWLAVRATASAKVFVFQSRLEGKSLRVRIGNVAAWDIDRAREEARRLQTLIDQGTDPRDERAGKAAEAEAKRQEREALAEAAARQEIQAGDAWSVYLEARRPRWSERHMRDHVVLARAGGEPLPNGKTSTPGPLASLLLRRLGDLTPAALKSWLETETASRPTSAALAYRLLRAFLNWTAEQPEYQGLVDPTAVLTKGVRENVPTPQTKADCLQREQLRPWFDAVHQNPNPVISAYLQTLLLTGARREELLGLTWDNVDFQWNGLTIKDKVEHERVIPLTPYVAALLAPLPRRNQWVFSSPTAESGRLQEPRIGHNKALATAGLPPLTLHGLRRSFGTLAEWVEVPVGIVAQIQGHKPSALAEKHYRRRPLDLLRKWHTKLEAWILEQAGIEQPEEIAPTQGLRVVK
jgi:integrase